MNHTTRILIVEDEAIIAEHLRIILNASGFNQISLAHDKVNALAAIERFKPELVLLDIRMKQPNDGIEIAEYLKKQAVVPFIFVTAHSDKGMLSKALETQPAGYITKPFNEASVYAAVKIALSKVLEKESEVLMIKDGFDLVKLDLHTLLYVQSEGNYIDIYAESGKKSFRYSLEWFISQVDDKQFMRVHRSYVINLQKVTKISGSNVVVNDRLIPVSRKSMQELRNRVLQTEAK